MFLNNGVQEESTSFMNFGVGRGGPFACLKKSDRDLRAGLFSSSGAGRGLCEN